MFNSSAIAGLVPQDIYNELNRRGIFANDTGGSSPKGIPSDQNPKSKVPNPAPPSFSDAEVKAYQQYWLRNPDTADHIPNQTLLQIMKIPSGPAREAAITKTGFQPVGQEALRREAAYYDTPHVAAATRSPQPAPNMLERAGDVLSTPAAIAKAGVALPLQMIVERATQGWGYNPETSEDRAQAAKINQMTPQEQLNYMRSQPLHNIGKPSLQRANQAAREKAGVIPQALGTFGAGLANMVTDPLTYVTGGLLGKAAEAGLAARAGAAGAGLYFGSQQIADLAQSHTPGEFLGNLPLTALGILGAVHGLGALRGTPESVSESAVEPINNNGPKVPRQGPGKGPKVARQGPGKGPKVARQGPGKGPKRTGPSSVPQAEMPTGVLSTETGALVPTMSDVATPSSLKAGPPDFKPTHAINGVPVQAHAGPSGSASYHAADGTQMFPNGKYPAHPLVSRTGTSADMASSGASGSRAGTSGFRLRREPVEALTEQQMGLRKEAIQRVKQGQSIEGIANDLNVDPQDVVNSMKGLRPEDLGLPGSKSDNAIPRRGTSNRRESFVNPSGNTLLEKARAEFRVDKRPSGSLQPGEIPRDSIYLNPAAALLLSRLFKLETDVGGFALQKNEMLGDVAHNMRQLAILDSSLNYNERQNLLNIASEFEQGIHKATHGVAINRLEKQTDTMRLLPFNIQKTLDNKREEVTHVGHYAKGETDTTSHLGAQLRAFMEFPDYQSAADNLTKEGYNPDDPIAMASEIGAHLVIGDRMGLSEDAFHALLVHYRNLLEAEHGIEGANTIFLHGGLEARRLARERTQISGYPKGTSANDAGATAAGGGELAPNFRSIGTGGQGGGKGSGQANLPGEPRTGGTGKGGSGGPNQGGASAVQHPGGVGGVGEETGGSALTPQNPVVSVGRLLPKEGEFVRVGEGKVKKGDYTYTASTRSPNSPSGRIVVQDSNEKIVGSMDFLLGYPQENHVYVGGIEVNPELRRQGIGQAMYQVMAAYVAKYHDDIKKVSGDVTNQGVWALRDRVFGNPIHVNAPVGKGGRGLKTPEEKWAFLPEQAVYNEDGSLDSSRMVRVTHKMHTAKETAAIRLRQAQMRHRQSIPHDVGYRPLFPW